MVKQYPHTISITTVAATNRDANGNFVAGTPVTGSEKKCRFEPSTGNAFITGAGGEKIYYSGIVYLPLPADQIIPGTMAIVKNGSTVLSNTKVLSFSSGQLNARVWL